jgi:hypothetical protein
MGEKPTEHEIQYVATRLNIASRYYAERARELESTGDPEQIFPAQMYRTSSMMCFNAIVGLQTGEVSMQDVKNKHLADLSDEFWDMATQYLKGRGIEF